MTPHQCVEGANPRMKGVCVQCGRRIPAPPPAPDGMARDPDFEQRFARAVSTSAGLPANALHHFADARAAPGSVRIDGRSLPLEAFEELADFFNYCCWEAYRRQMSGEKGCERLVRAVGYAVLAWFELAAL